MLYYLKFLNFKGQSASFEFHEQTRIGGRNATGKTTILDAYLWLLYGYDSLDRADFHAWPYSDGKPVIDGGVQVYVEAELSGFDGNTYKLRRELKPKVSNDRITGYTSQYFVDDVPTKASEYQKFVDERILPQRWGKILTVPGYFAEGMRWDERRKVLVELLDLQELERRIMEEYLYGVYDVEKEKVMYTSRKKGAEDAIQDFSTRLQEIENMEVATVDMEKWQKLTESQGHLANEISTLEQKMAEFVAKVKDKISEVERRKMAYIDAATSDAQKRQREAAEKYQREMEVYKSDLQKWQRRQSELKSRLIDFEHQLEVYRADYATNAKKREQSISDLKKQIAELESSEIPEFVMCPVNGQGCPVLDNSAAREKHNQEIMAAKEQLAQLEKDVIFPIETMQRYGELNSEIAELKRQMSILPEPLPPTMEQVEIPKVDASNYDREIDAIRAEGNEEYQRMAGELRSLKEVLEGVKTEVLSIEAAVRQNEQIERRKKELKDYIGVQKEVLRNAIQILKRIEDFQKAFYAEVEKVVNEFFAIPTLEVVMFRQLLNGNFEPACDFYIAGVPYMDANHAAKVAAGVQMIEKIAKKLNYKPTIWLDNAESVNDLPQVENAQVIALYVTEDEKLKMF